MQPLIITATPNISWLHPEVDYPCTPEAIAEEACQCCQNGAAILHTHAEERWAESIRAVRAKRGIIALLTKDFVGYFVNHKTCFPQRFYFWQSLAAPLLAGTVHWALLRWLTGFIWKSDQISSVLIFFIGILPSFPFFMFFYGLFGGWDQATLDELKQAVDISGFVRPLAWVIWASSALGARVSPLNGRFPITNRPAAMEEAKALTAEKVKL